jgi:chromosome segregation ATPase
MAVPERIGGILVDFQPMSPEEMQGTMQFLLRQQAQFASDFERLLTKTDRMADAIIGLTVSVGHLQEAQQETDRQLRETDRRFKETDTRLGELGEYIKTVESHLDVVIEMFERHLREDHGHRPS